MELQVCYKKFVFIFNANTFLFFCSSPIEVLALCPNNYHSFAN